MKILRVGILILVLFSLIGTAMATDNVEQSGEEEKSILELIKNGIPFVILIAASYVGAFLGSLILKDEGEGVVFSLAAYGSIGWIAGFLSGYFGLPDLTQIGIVMGTVVFALLGMSFYLIFTILDRSSD